MSNVIHVPTDPDAANLSLHAKFANWATGGNAAGTMCNLGVPEVTVKEMLQALQIDFADVDYGRHRVKTDDDPDPDLEDPDADEEEEEDD
jgi:hypothetical protein